MELGLMNRIAVVTGGSEGIGKAAAFLAAATSTQILFTFPLNVYH